MKYRRVDRAADGSLALVAAIFAVTPDRVWPLGVMSYRETRTATFHKRWLSLFDLAVAIQELLRSAKRRTM